MKLLTRYLLAAAVAGMAGHSQAMRFLVQENRVFASGAMEEGDAGQLQVLLATHKEVGELVLVNVTGAGIGNGLTLGKEVAERGLKSTVVGYCMGACVPVFLGGKDRRFASGEHPRRTLVAIQGAFAGMPARPDARLNQQWLAWLKERLGSRFDETLMRQAIEQGDDAGGYLRVRETGRTSQDDRRPLFCASGQTLAQDCIVHSGKDALSLGIVATAETASLALPGSFVPAPEFFGRSLTAPTPEFVKTLGELGLAMCGPNAVCVQRWEAALPVYMRQKANRAAALGEGKPGLGFSDDQESADLAAKRAIFLCNHTPGNKKFCRVAAINDVVVDGDYADSQARSRAAADALKLPSIAIWEGEDADRGVVSPSSLRMRDLQGPTPKAISGARTWTTGELAQAVKTAPPVLIDVGGAGESMLPAALHFWEGGMALADPAAEAAFEQRFRDMLDIAAPTKDRPVVFYCKDAECWTAINAALRAIKAGYTQVGWYRGGLASWTKAGLPLTRKVPVAVIN